MGTDLASLTLGCPCAFDVIKDVSSQQQTSPTQEAQEKQKLYCLHRAKSAFSSPPRELLDFSAASCQGQGGRCFALTASLWWKFSIPLKSHLQNHTNRGLCVTNFGNPGVSTTSWVFFGATITFGLFLFHLSLSGIPARKQVQSYPNWACAPGHRAPSKREEAKKWTY